MSLPSKVVRGLEIWTEYLEDNEQKRMVDDLRIVVASAPLFSPDTPYGKPMSVKMTSAGRFGWYSDRSGYRYIAEHPSGCAWPPIPRSVMRVWNSVAECERQPDCCLVNYYMQGSKMGMHRDSDEANFEFPVVSISLGDSALFRIGNLNRGGKTESLWLRSGDVVVMGGEGRLVYHGVDRIEFGSSSLLRNGGRVNLTLRVVD
ncbi:MAG: alpha-ketoglutarate-dependent dioxygenase AlkB [Albidovulum sp.]|nr:alpha-ketoglutarate-dependent dioxygenase AlkB [Albidovulum sp.]MDE0307790.1 alpha-ketoglutarate-dependent dioxygenase AlkB [Albidovulum sp.]MDE0532034.1 alpha-ketoglutarate-dependent dioxygenase AlkB [Albidovulum sp.]